MATASKSRYYIFNISFPIFSCFVSDAWRQLRQLCRPYRRRVCCPAGAHIPLSLPPAPHGQYDVCCAATVDVVFDDLRHLRVVAVYLGVFEHVEVSLVSCHVMSCYVMSCRVVLSSCFYIYLFLFCSTGTRILFCVCLFFRLV